MSNEQCYHEDGISYGITTYQDATMKVTQVMCDDCHAFGTVVEKWSDDDNDYQHDSETWHNIRNYGYLISSEV